jgi:O-antigen/teichoic acid export membrane protein
LSPSPGADLGLRRLFALWWPLALTYVLVTGGTPIINGSINRLPIEDHTGDLAAFAVFLQCIIILHSPLLVTREIAIRMSVDRAGSRRALRFCLAAGAVVSALEAILGLTPLGPMLLRAFTTSGDLAERAHRAFLAVSPVPLLVAVRGVYQAHQIRADDTLFVGLGTLLRLVLTAVLGLLVAPHLEISGPMLGALCLTVGLVTESVFATGRARARARPPERSDIPPPGLFGFALPLMFANLLGVATQFFYVRIAGAVPEGIEDASLAGFHEVKSIHFLIGAGALALQPLVTAKAHVEGDVPPLRRFALVSGTLLTGLCALLAFVGPLRDWVLVDLLKEKPEGDVARLATPAFAVAALLPFLGAVRFFLRGVLISRGHTRAITLSNVLVLGLLAAVVPLGLLPFPANGALSAYCVWGLSLLIEIAILARAIRVRGDGAAPLPPPVRSPREASAG